MNLDEDEDEDEYVDRSDEWFRERAQELYGREGLVEIDDNALISRGCDPGAYVEAWVWVPYKENKEQDPD